MDKTYTDVYQLGRENKLLAFVEKDFIGEKHDGAIDIASSCKMMLVKLKDSFNYCRDLIISDEKIDINPDSCECHISVKAIEAVKFDGLRLFFESDSPDVDINKLSKKYSTFKYREVQNVSELNKEMVKEYGEKDYLIKTKPFKNRKIPFTSRGILNNRYLDAEKVASNMHPFFSKKEYKKYDSDLTEGITLLGNIIEKNKYLLLYDENRGKLSSIVDRSIDYLNNVFHVIRFDLKKQVESLADYSVTKLSPINTNIVGKYENELSTFLDLLSNSDEHTLVIFDNYEPKHSSLIDSLNEESIGKAKIVIMSSSVSEVDTYSKLKAYNLAKLSCGVGLSKKETDLSFDKQDLRVIMPLLFTKDSCHTIDNLKKMSIINKKKIESEIKSLCEKRIIKKDGDKLSLDYECEESIVSQDISGNKNISNYISEKDVLSIFKKIFLSELYKDINLLFFTVNQSSNLALDNNLSRRYIFGNSIKKEIEKLIAKNNKDVNSALVMLDLFPSYIEEIVFRDKQFIINNKPRHRSFLISNSDNKSLAIYDYDARKTYMLCGSFGEKYHIVGHFGIFDSIEKLPKYIENDTKEFKIEKVRMNDVNKCKSVYDFDGLYKACNKAIKDSIYNYQSQGTTEQLEDLIKSLNEEIVYYNMKKNFVDSDNKISMLQSISLHDRSIQSVDYLLSLPDLGLKKEFVCDYLWWMSYHHGVNEWSKGDIDKAIEYYNNATAIAEDFLSKNICNKKTKLILINDIATSLNQTANCLYERIREEKEINNYPIAESLYIRAIDCQEEFCKEKADDGRYAMLALYHNNLGRLYTSYPEPRVKEAENQFKKSYSILSKLKTDRRVADSIVGYYTNLNVLLDLVDNKKNDSKIKQNYDKSMELIKKWDLNLSVSISCLCTYLNHVVKMGGHIEESDMNKLMNYYNNLNDVNPRHIVRKKEIEQLLKLINKILKIDLNNSK